MARVVKIPESPVERIDNHKEDEHFYEDCPDDFGRAV